jgi:simple sugar transport system permease protein
MNDHRFTWAIDALLSPRSISRLVLIAAILFAVFSLLAPEYFPTLINLRNIGYQAPEIGLLGMAIMLSMVTGGIDLSVVAVANLAGLMAVLAMGRDGSPVLGVVVALTVGAACGAANGMLVGLGGITPILATLGAGWLFQGFAIGWTGGKSVLGLPQSYTTLGNGLVFGVPVPVIIIAIAAILAALVLNRTATGARMTLIGANDRAARFSGLRSARVLIFTYTFVGLLAATAGIIITARNAAATPGFGGTYLLLAVVISVFAGVNPEGGLGTVAGVLVATFILVIIKSGFDLLGVDQFLYQVAQGLIVIGVLALNAATGRLSLPRRSTLPANPRQPHASDSRDCSLERE